MPAAASGSPCQNASTATTSALTAAVTAARVGVDTGHRTASVRPLIPSHEAPPGGISGERTPKYSTCRAQTSRRNRGHATRAAIARNIEKVTPLFLIPAIGEGELDGRIDRFVDARLRLQSAVAPTFRAARIRATFDPLVSDDLDASRRFLRAQIERHFAKELQLFDAAQAAARTAGVDALFMFEALDHYLVHRNLAPTDARPLLVDSLGALLHP